MYILGISALYHDAAACLIKDDKIIAAAQEERFTRIKHDANLPKNAIEYVIKEAGIKSENLDCVAFYDDPILSMERFLLNVAWCGEDSYDLIERSFDDIFCNKLWFHNEIKKILNRDISIYVCKHHISHAASAFFPSPFFESIILTIDGVGEWQTTTIGIGKGNTIEIKEEINYPNSLGLFYSAFTYYCGFKVNSGDYKFMGLAPYGKPVYVDIIKNEIIDIKNDGSFVLNLKYFDFQNGRSMINQNLEKLFGKPRRNEESKIEEFHMNIAASVQMITEEIILKMAIYAKNKYGKNIDNIVLAGGCALNCVANGKLLKSNIYNNIWIQPAAGDAGGAIGAAMYLYYKLTSNERNCFLNNNYSSCLGPHYSLDEIENYLINNKINYKKYDENTIFEVLSDILADGKVVGLFQGRMEYGPRALGNRSIIADPRSEYMQSKLNLKIKYRESFRPFAPAVLAEDATEYFELKKESPYMLFTSKVVKSRIIEHELDEQLANSNFDMINIVNMKRSDIPAVTHVDYSARIQTVSYETNPYFYNVINSFKKKTGCSVIVNTSFNVRGEPIVCTLADAYNCFINTEIDVLVFENFVVLKNDQIGISNVNKLFKREYELD